MLDGEVSQSRKMLYVFPVIFLLVSVFVILTTVNRLILEERTEIGTLKGLGFSRGEILRHYASFGGILCLIGGLVGAAIGPFIVPNVMKVKYQLVYSLPFPALPSFDILGSLLSVGLVALLAGADQRPRLPRRRQGKSGGVYASCRTQGQFLSQIEQAER